MGACEMCSIEEIESRFAADSDLDLLAEWNYQLIQDEGHRNPMTVPELRERMRDWLPGEYQAVIFNGKVEPLAYALYRENETEIHLRQLFVRRDRRREGIGRKTVDILRRRIWPQNKRLTVDILSSNVVGIHFWRAVGFKDYCLTLESCTT